MTIYWKHFLNGQLDGCRSHSKTAHLKTLLVLLLLFVDYAKPEVDLVGLLKVRRHLHHLREGLLGVFQRSVAIIQNAYSIPKLRFLSCNERQIRRIYSRSLPWDLEDDRGLADTRHRHPADFQS